MEPQAFDEGWEKVRTAIWGNVDGAPARTALQKGLQDLLGTFQGTGSVLFGLDGVRLLDSLAEAEKDGDPSASPDDLNPEIKSYLSPLNPNRLWAQSQTVIRKLRDFRAELSGYIDAAFDKNAFISELEEVAALLTSTSNWTRNDISLKDFERRLIDFRSTPIVDLMNKATLVDEANAEQLPKVLNALGS
ncbi:MAG: hypothetical protein INR64_07755, partial [Caulobacteraceae bacterium]|nr:hypothetical protein [Caulobacter sp.]